MQPKFCTACGAALATGAAFCTACGARVQAAAGAPAPPVAPAPASPPAPPAGPPPAAAPASAQAPLPAQGGVDWNSPELQPGEADLGTWTVNHPAPSGSLVNGKLTVTNHRLLFKPLVAGVSVYKIVRSQTAGFQQSHTLVLRKDEIASVRTEKSFLKKKVLVTATNGATYVFDRGAMSVDEIARAIEQRWSVS